MSLLYPDDAKFIYRSGGIAVCWRLGSYGERVQTLAVVHDVRYGVNYYFYERFYCTPDYAMIRLREAFDVRFEDIEYEWKADNRPKRNDTWCPLLADGWL